MKIEESKIEKEMRCKYCGRIVKQVGRCGVCKDCCKAVISVCSKSKECGIGKRIWKDIFKDLKNKKKKLRYSFSHNHLVPLIGFRVDLHENGDFFDSMDESVCFNIEKIENNKLYVRVYHVRYINKIRGDHLEGSSKLYEIDLNKSWNEWNVKEIKEKK